MTITRDTIIREHLLLIKETEYPQLFKLKIERYLVDRDHQFVRIDIYENKIIIKITKKMYRETYSTEYHKKFPIIKCTCHNIENTCSVKYRVSSDTVYYSTLSTFGELKFLYNRLIKRYVDTQRFLDISKRDLWLRIFEMEKRIKKLEKEKND